MGHCGNPRDFAVIYYPIRPRLPLFLSRLTAYYMFLLSIIKTENVKMNQNEEVPDNLGGLGDLLLADSLEGHNANIVTSLESVRDAYLLIEKIKSH